MHRRLIHAGKDTVIEAYNRAKIQLTAKNEDFCEGYVVGKKTNELGKQAPIQGTQPLNHIHVDLVTHHQPSHLGYRYSMHIVDVASNYHWVKFTKTKLKVFKALTE